MGGEEVEQGRRKERVENEVSTVQSKEEKKKEARKRGEGHWRLCRREHDCSEESERARERESERNGGGEDGGQRERKNKVEEEKPTLSSSPSRFSKKRKQCPSSRTKTFCSTSGRLAGASRA